MYINFEFQGTNWYPEAVFAVEMCSRRFFYFKGDKNRAKFGEKFKKWLKIGAFAL